MTNLVSNLSKTKYKVTGFNLENFLFKLTSSGIALSKIKKKKHSLVFITSSANHNLVLSVAAEFSLEVSVLKQIGFIAYIKKLPYSIGAFLGIAFSIAFIYLSTNNVQYINYIIPTEHTCKNHENCIFLDQNLLSIKDYVSQNIQIGKRYSATKKLEIAIKAKFTLVEECNIEKTGNMVTIKLKEADQKHETSYTKLVAQQNCIITSITTFSGKSLVKAGDVVIKGQTLVEAEDGIMPRAKIMAKVFYTGISLYNANTQVLQATGKTTTTTSLSFMGKTILKGKDNPYELYSETKSESYVSNWFLPIKKQTIVYKELEVKNIYVPFEEVRTQILAQAKADALTKTTGSPVECTYSIVTEGDTTRVDCYLQVIEEVGIKA